MEIDKQNVKKPITKRKRRKRKTVEDNVMKKNISSEFLNLLQNYENGELDEYEMLCVRGASPPKSNKTDLIFDVKHPDFQRYQNDDNDEDYNFGEYQKMSSQQKRAFRRRTDLRYKNSEKCQKTNNSKELCVQHMSANCDTPNCTKSHEGRCPRKLQLCQNFCMATCPNHVNCSYMHNEFPCSYYYLGIKGHQQNRCKFSHGKPLTKEMRVSLVNSIKNMPKNSKASFPQFPTSQLELMLNRQHKILLKRYNIKDNEDDIATIEIDDKFTAEQDDGVEVQDEQDDEHNDSNNNNKVHDNIINNTNTEVSVPPVSLPFTGDQQFIPDHLKIDSLSDVLSMEQIEKFKAFGIISLDRIQQLTIGKLIESNINVKQLTALQEIYFNRHSLENIKIIKERLKSDINCFIKDCSNTNEDVDMRIIPQILSTSECSSVNQPISSLLKEVSEITTKINDENFCQNEFNYNNNDDEDELTDNDDEPQLFIDEYFDENEETEI